MGVASASPKMLVAKGWTWATAGAASNSAAKRASARMSASSRVVGAETAHEQPHLVLVVAVGLGEGRHVEFVGDLLGVGALVPLRLHRIEQFVPEPELV